MVVYSQGDIFLEIFKAFRDEGFYSERKFELVNLLLVREMAEDGGPAPVLETLEVPLEEAEAHLCLGGGAARRKYADGPTAHSPAARLPAYHASMLLRLAQGRRARR